MGDFDKKQEASAADAAAKEKKKLAMVGVLGAALLGVLVWQFKGGPQSVGAQSFGGPAGGDQALVSPEQTPAQALAGLDPSKDPTKDLLLGSAALPENLMAVPRNPFKLSDEWRTVLVKQVDTPKLEPVRPVIDTPRAVVTQPKAPPADVAGLKLQGIFRQGDKLFASINGQILTVNATIGKARIVEIRDEQVLLRHADWPGGPVTALSLKKN
jgi:hypothetical protein